MATILGKYYIKVNTDYAFALPGYAGGYYQFWTDDITYELDNTITFEPINTPNKKEGWPKAVNIHTVNCAIFQMKD